MVVPKPPVDKTDSVDEMSMGDGPSTVANGVYAGIEDDVSTIFSDSDDDYRTPRKKTRKSRKRESSVTSTRVTRSQKKVT